MNKDYFQLPIDIEDLLSDRIKRQLHKERPSQIKLTEDLNGRITSFKVNENKKSNALRSIEIATPEDLEGFKLLFDRISKSMIET